MSLLPIFGASFKKITDIMDAVFYLELLKALTLVTCAAFTIFELLIENCYYVI